MQKTICDICGKEIKVYIYTLSIERKSAFDIDGEERRYDVCRDCVKKLNKEIEYKCLFSKTDN